MRPVTILLPHGGPPPLLDAMLNLRKPIMIRKLEDFNEQHLHMHLG